MAHTKSQGKTNQKSNRPGQRRGVKLFGDQKVAVGQIIVRQVGSKYKAGEGTKFGKDFTVSLRYPSRNCKVFHKTRSQSRCCHEGLKIALPFSQAVFMVI